MRPTGQSAFIVAIVAVITCAVAAGAQTAPRTAADCERLRTLRLTNTTITIAEPVSGSFNVPASRDTIRNLPPLCRVA